MKSIIFSITLVMLLNIGAAQETKSTKTQTIYEKPAIEMANGLPIVLPKVLVTVTIIQNKTTIKPGKYFIKEAIQKLRDESRLISPLTDDSILDIFSAKKNIITYEIKEATLTPFSVADQNKKFRVLPGKKWNKDQTVEITYGEGGTISSGKMETTDKTFEIITKGLTTIFELAGAFMLKSDSAAILKNKKSRTGDENKILTTYEKLSERDKALVNHPNYRQYDSIYVQYLSLEKNKNEIIQNSSSVTHSEVFNKQIELIEKQQQALLELITWKTSEKSYTVKMDIEPCGLENKTTTLFYFTDSTGIIIDSALFARSYNPYTFPEGIKIGTIAKSMENIGLELKPINITPVLSCIDQKAIETSISILNDNKYLLPYNQPKQVQFRLKHISGKKAKPLVGAVLNIPQFGPIGFLDGSKMASELTYDPVTGALKSVKASSTSVIAGNITTAGEVIKTGITTFKPTKQTELEKLEEEAKLLEARKKIKDLKSSLGEQ
jgi:hypothetical protein